MKSHKLIDERSLAFGRAIARRVAKQPELIALAQANLWRWLTTCSAGARPALEEWQALLEGPIDAVISLLTESSERAVRLRQSNPFAGVLSPQERSAILQEFQAHDAASA